MFGSARLALAERYAGLLAGDGTVRGLIGPREVPRLWERHLINCAVVSELVPADASVCDIGSGAGLPGVVLAIARPDLRVTLVEPLLRRTAYLEAVVSELGLENCEVRRMRAEALHGQARYDVVTSRAVAPLPKLLAWSLPLVAPRGAVVAMKGARAAAEVADAAQVLRRLGCAAEVLELGAGAPTCLDPPTTVVRVVRSGSDVRG
ncbi:16S rRNA (guanine(527)-N(7))-methyltransferase RsmG [Nocardioides sp.]|uniref:16S rRNA (guanine(527)-N(7))-methyltransferase RsmG n=1 Tax=Nocardioides sp. TaxID=35761 RepID=UPI002ED270F2